MTKFTVTLESATTMTKAQAYSQYGLIAETLAMVPSLALIDIADDTVQAPPKRIYTRKKKDPEQIASE